MKSLAVKRIIAGVAGAIYAVIYGLWTMIATGGGHVNFTWIALFVFVEFFGLYFPLMTILAVDLRFRLTKIIFGSLIGFNLVASTVMILGWITETGGDRPSDFSRAFRANGAEGILFCAALHFLPTVIFAFLLIKSILSGGSLSDEDCTVSLNLS